MYLTKLKINAAQFPTQRIYPFNIPVLNHPAELSFTRQVVLFVGENGSGKSTLLEAITRKCGFHIWHKPKRHLAHQNPLETRLADFITITWSNGPVPGSLFRAETFHDFADFLDDVALCDPGRLKYHGGRILNTLSHGEAILSYLSHRFNRGGLFFLDEPESALSPARQLEFLNLLGQLETGGNTQFFIATHSPILLAHPGAQIFSFDFNRIEEVAYEDTSHYKIYRRFFDDRSAFITNVDAVT
ncbi:MAG: AAA family ATPase [Anaerolineales bacterium]|nr:AAA family ATPase [Anaerolineales bacterium]